MTNADSASTDDATETMDFTPPKPPDRPDRAMAIFAHPDDADFMCAGTMAKWAKHGAEVILVVITDGSKGSDDPDLPRDRLIRMRMEEQRAAAKCVGAADVLFLGYEDGALYDCQSVRRDLTRVIRERKPDAVLCGDPRMRFSGPGYINHPDHVAAANAALAAVYPLARNRPSFPELLAIGLEPHTVRHVFLAGTNEADTWIDISETMDQKVEALRQHLSQIPPDEVGKWVREWGRRDGRDHGYEYAESFRYLAPG
jgi:LmbE family N-acetylglucosaminyl deacetylase